MNSLKTFVLVSLFGVLCIGCSAAPPPRGADNRDADHTSEADHWGYEGVEGPAHWALLDSSYTVCETGREQSPINIVVSRDGEGQEELEFHYRPTRLRLQNNGHTIQVNYQGGSSLQLNSREYKLRQFHFHDPSEHHIDGKVYPMEMHLVHQDKKGHLLVVAVLLTFGRENAAFARVGEWMQQHTGQRLPSAGEQVATDLTFDLMDVLPSDTNHYSYHGSLTTPPCSEGVRWIVLKTPIEISKEQATRFVATIGVNARPVQPDGERNPQEY